MDGDPLNAFSKHVEVITASLGATFADMIRLKKMYYRRLRALDQRRQQANRRASNIVMAWKSESGYVAWSEEMQRKCETTMVLLKKMEANLKAINRPRFS
ncbi:Voltage-gated Ion Channel (VIC) Superfamily [Phytophthora palmivora]|uniref:Voltage-gated Ion Channel (VIC) Superfamily n=1 Tax=Phytophthora palmivora TaxID=4796 RepID=A0A2P4YAD5_9STRA|nr:Voltage-gated Ion Channel (VIC) Superfamily [Phytophthora palmivora]